MNRTHRTTRSITIRMLGLLGAIALATAMLTVGGPTAPASAAPMAQCNGVGGGGGEGYDCAVTITNQYDVATGIGSSTVRTVVCNGPANTDPLPTCADSGILSFAELTESVTQCNGTIGGNGGSLYCSVTVTNTIVGAATTGTATVNQCVGSLGGGGIVPGSVCDPIQETSGATVTQCNGSVNGGGGYMVCTVDASSTSNSAFPFTVNQCNGSAEGTGNLMVCSTAITTLVLPADGDGDGDGGSDGGVTTTASGGAGELAATGTAEVSATVARIAVFLLTVGGLLLLRSRRSLVTLA